DRRRARRVDGLARRDGRRGRESREQPQVSDHFLQPHGASPCRRTPGLRAGRVPAPPPDLASAFGTGARARHVPPQSSAKSRANAGLFADGPPPRPARGSRFMESPPRSWSESLARYNGALPATAAPLDARGSLVADLDLGTPSMADDTQSPMTELIEA